MKKCSSFSQNRIKNWLSCQALFTKMHNSNKATKVTYYKPLYIIAQHGKPFTDDKIMKECLMEAANQLCPNQDVEAEAQKFYCFHIGYLT